MTRSRVTAFELSRLAVPIPAFLPSVNQIGFDSYDFLVAPVRISGSRRRGGSLALWVISARRLADGRTVPDPGGGFLFPLSGRYRRDSVVLSAGHTSLTFSFATVPLDVFQFRGRLSRSLRFRPGASLFASAQCDKVPFYGPFLPLFRLCNNHGALVASGTFITRRYVAPRAPGVDARPGGLGLRSLTLERPTAGADGAAVATLSLRPGARYSARRHVAGILLTDAASGRPVDIGYRDATAVTRDAHGNVAEVRLTIPRGARLPARIRAYVMADVFPLAARDF